MADLNQQDIVDQIVQNTRGQGKREVTQLQARTVLQMQRDIVLGFLQADPSRRVLLTGFGIIYVRRVKARTIKHVRTGSQIVVPGRLTLRMKFTAKIRNGVIL